MEYAIDKIASAWGVPPWTLDPSHLRPREYRWLAWKLEMMSLEGQFGG